MLQETRDDIYQNYSLWQCGAPGKALLLLSCVFVVMMLPGRAFCAHVYEDVMGVLAILTTAPYFLFFCRWVSCLGFFFKYKAEFHMLNCKCIHSLMLDIKEHVALTNNLICNIITNNSNIFVYGANK